MNTMPWQLVMVCWGTKYGAKDINRLHDAAKANSPSLTRTVLITDLKHSGLRPEIQTTDFPIAFSDSSLRGPGCQAKLSIFLKGVVPDDIQAIYCDLDSAVLGDLAEILAAQTERQLGILQSTYLPANAFTRVLHRLTKRRRYARGNSSIVAFHPKHQTNIADEFLRIQALPGPNPKPLSADERFMSWSAQEDLCFISPKLAVKFTREFMGKSIDEVRARATRPSTIERRKRLIFITFNQDAIKPSRFANFTDGEVIEDSKGRVTEWSDAALGELKGTFVRYFA